MVSKVNKIQEPDRRSERQIRTRLLTEKGKEFQISLKMNSLKSKRNEFALCMRKTLLLRGQCDEVARWKQEFSKAQVLAAEFEDIQNEILELNVQGNELKEVEFICQKILGEWKTFEHDVRAEIEHLSKLQYIQLESEARSSAKRSARSRESKTARDQRIELEKERAALEVKLAFAAEQTRLRVEQEEMRERLKLQQEIAENEARLGVCRRAEREEIMELEQDLGSVPPEDKDEDMRKFLEYQTIEVPKDPEIPNSVPSVPITQSGSVEVNACQSTPIVSSYVKPSLTKEVSPIVQDYTPGSGKPSQLNPMAQSYDPNEKREKSKPLNVDRVKEPPSNDSTASGWEKVATSLEHCVTKLIESSEKLALANVSQSKVSKPSNQVFHLPSVKIPVFCGDPLEYPVWSSTFKALVDSREMDADTKLNLMNQYVSGSPKQVVEHYLLIGTENAYVEAKSVLQERYGNSNVVSSAFLNKLEKWPKIGPRDAKSLREFSDFLNKIAAARKTIASLAILDFAKENAKLVAKLPYHLESKWRDVIAQSKSSGNESDYPSFLRFAEFIKEASDKANIPELENTSRLNNQPMSSLRSERSPRSPGVAAFATTASTFKGQKRDNKAVSGTTARTKTESPNNCLFCKEHHKLNDCMSFRDKSFKERKAFFFKKRLCMGCAQSNQHQAKECKDRLKCKTCEGRHPTCLHKEESDLESDSTSENEPKEVIPKCTSVCSVEDQDGIDNAMIVPVWVRLEKEPRQEILQYAVLDDQANVSFISENLCRRLNVSGPETTLKLSTVQEERVLIQSKRICGLEILDYQKHNVIKLPTTYTRPTIPANRSQIPKPDAIREWSHLQQVADKLMPYKADVEVSLLIGSNCTRAIRPREIIARGEDEPYGQKTILGWGVVGTICKTPSEDVGADANCCRTAAKEDRNHFVFASKTKEIISPEAVINVLAKDFNENLSESKPYSVQDSRFVRILEGGIKKLPNGHYEMPLPLKTDNVTLPNNRPLAVKRWNQLNARFNKSPEFLKDYQLFMKDVIENCAERVPLDRLNINDGQVNYVPHTGVYHPRKKDKIRVVFDCSARYDGTCLNDHLLQGPDFMNGLLGILCRFRREEVAVATDIQGMFHQFMVPEENRDLLRFLWWENGDPTGEVIEYRMKVHLFGASSSPGCANFGLKRAADDGEVEFGKHAADFIRQDFYVDDGLKSEPDVPKAIKLIKNSQGICAKAGLRLHKVVSNRREVLEAISPEDRAKEIKNLNLEVDSLPLERVLGVTWCVENDAFQFRIELNDRPPTRRGILSTVGSIFDPLGFLAPVVITAKQILQQMCKDKLDWDAPVSDDLRPRWEQWRREIIHLDKLRIRRCVKPKNFGELKAVEVHHFSDASTSGYGQCSYLRLINTRNRAHCSFLTGKARVTPLKQITVPRLELVAATLSAKMSQLLSTELMYPEQKDIFWTDSKTVLGYINNEARKFQVFVANRVQQIRNLTDPSKWNYVESAKNPADDASRGISTKQLTDECRWLKGPEFLWRDGVFEDTPTSMIHLSDTDPEVKKVEVLKTSASQPEKELKASDVDMFSHISRWDRLLRVVALCRRFAFGRKQQDAEQSPASKAGARGSSLIITATELEDAKKSVIWCLQNHMLKEEVKVLNTVADKKDTPDKVAAQERNRMLKKHSCLFRLDPFIDNTGLIRVGGRIKRANVPMELKHPVVIPKGNHVAELLVRHYHNKVHHMGRGITHNELRQQGYWITGGSSTVGQYLSKCTVCKRLRGSLQVQKMSDLPADRIEPSPPFSYCGVDYFGPFLVKERRSEVKRYGAVFTCLSSRAVHLEAASSLDTSSFINALRRFMNRRGPVKQIRSDRGTNFIGARNELKAALAELNQEEVQRYLAENECEWVPFKMNTPHSSHMGGIWERQIRTIRSVLDALMLQNGTQLNDEAFQTFLTEAEYIINSRPLTVSNLNAPDGLEPLTPNHLITMKPKIVLPPPGKFQREDVYSRKWWKRVQYMANQFWQRWRVEYLNNLQARQKWIKPQRNLTEGDIVIVKEDQGRCKWPLARVVGCYPSEDGLVRKVQLLMSDRNLDNQGKRRQAASILDRPVHKLVLLLASDDE